MTIKNNNFDPQEFLRDLRVGMDLLPQAEKIGSELTHNGIRKIFLVGCGAPNYLFQVIASWANLWTDQVDIQTLYPSELVARANKLDSQTLVLFGSHSGTTSETVEAAKFLEPEFDQTMAITQFSESPLGQNVCDVLAYGSTKQGYFSTYILAQMLISAFIQSSSEKRTLHPKIKSSLFSLPAVLADAKLKSFEKAEKLSSQLEKKNNIYIVGAGPMYTTAYVFAACFLMEMQRMHAQPIKGLDFFHGPFEVLDKSTPIILLMGEDDSRGIAERVLRFCETQTDGCIVYDSRQFQMTGIEPEIRALVAPFVVDAALTNLVEQLAIRRKFPMETRRYMNKVDY